jgi:hypothetical protein
MQGKLGGTRSQHAGHHYHARRCGFGHGQAVTGFVATVKQLKQSLNQRP